MTPRPNSPKSPKTRKTFKTRMKSDQQSAAKRKRAATATPLVFHPLTPDRWRDIEALFGERGACGGCWCMAWRLSSAEFQKHKGAGNRQKFKRIVEDQPLPPGILAYSSGEPVGWCAIAPRQTYVRLASSRVLKPIDDLPVWSISCFFVARPWRRSGVSVRLIEAAVDFARSHGAERVEGYPVKPYAKKMPDAFAWVGTLASFQRAGFSEAGRHSKTRPIMRREL